MEPARATRPTDPRREGVRAHIVEHCVDDGEDRQSPEGPESLHFLRAALILGKCRDGLYDPARPVVWTEGRLSRSVRLYGIGGNFYTDDEAVSLSGGHGKANT